MKKGIHPGRVHARPAPFVAPLIPIGTSGPCVLRTQIIAWTRIACMIDKS